MSDVKVSREDASVNAVCCCQHVVFGDESRTAATEVKSTRDAVERIGKKGKPPWLGSPTIDDVLFGPYLVSIGIAVKEGRRGLFGPDTFFLSHV